MHFTADQAWWSGPWSRERPLCWDGMYVRIPSYHTWPYGIIGREVGPAAWVQRNGEERANIPGACVAFETPLFRRTSCGQHTDIPTPAYDITAGLYDMITQWCSSLMRSIPYYTTLMISGAVDDEAALNLAGQASQKSVGPACKRALSLAMIQYHNKAFYASIYYTIHRVLFY